MIILHFQLVRDIVTNWKFDLDIISYPSFWFKDSFWVSSMFSQASVTYKGIAKSCIRFLNQHDITIRFARSTTTLNQVLENVQFMHKCSDRLRTRDGAVDPFFFSKD